MGKKTFNNEKKMFFQTITDMRRLIESNTKSYTSETLAVSKKKTQIPYNHLMGRRAVLKKKHKAQKARSREEAIQYDSSMRLLNSSVMQKYEKSQKDEFQKNKYKYEGSRGGIGRQKNGFLELTQKDVNKIYGKEKNQEKKKQIEKFNQKKNKKRFIKKRKKNQRK